MENFIKKFNLMNESYWNSIIILYAQCRTQNHAYLGTFDIVILFHFIESKNMKKKTKKKSQLFDTFPFSIVN